MTTPEELAACVGSRLAKARRQRGMTQRQMADALGMSLSHVTQVERGAKSPSLDVLARWAVACRVTLAEVFRDIESDMG